MGYRRCCVDISDDGRVIGVSVTWHRALNADVHGIWCDPSPARDLTPAEAFDYALEQEHAQLSMFD